MPQNVWCDAKDCIFYDEEWGECDVYRLKIEGGVCVGHPRSGRNVTSNDAVEKLKDENEKLRKLADAVKAFVEDTHCEDCPYRRDCYDNNRIFCANTFSHNAFAAMRKLGIEVDG